MDDRQLTEGDNTKMDLMPNYRLVLFWTTRFKGEAGHCAKVEVTVPCFHNVIVPQYINPMNIG
jgi:hypothetical protein